MKFNKQQESYLIELGLMRVLAMAMEPIKVQKPVKKSNRGRKKGTKNKKWTPEQHKKFARTMKRIWKEKKAKSE